MKPPKIQQEKYQSLGPKITSLIDCKNPLKILADEMNWDFFEKELHKYYKSGPGHPPKPIRLMVGLLMLEHIYKLSDEKIVLYWVGNPYFQYFCGYAYFIKDVPINPSSLTRFRQRIGEKGVRKILQFTIKEVIKQRLVTSWDLKQVIVDTTVMEKNIAYPTDTNLLNNVRKKLVKKAIKHNIKLRQNYKRLGPKLVLRAGRYAHAKQFKRMQRCNKKLKTYLRRVVRDIQRKLPPEENTQQNFEKLFEIANYLLRQEKGTRDKIYSIHEPNVYCIAKGKSRKPYEYGSKVSIVTTKKQGIVLDISSLVSNEHDGHTLQTYLQQAEKNSGFYITKAFVDKGYRGHGITNKKVYISGQKRGITKYMQRELKKRSAIEAHISHMKNQGKLAKNYLKGIIGDKINALLCGVGHNIRYLIANNCLIIFKWLWQTLFFSQKNDCERFL